MSNIIDKLTPIFNDIFDDENLKIDASTRVKDIEQWDSMAHLRLIITIENDFEISFTTEEMSNITSVGCLESLMINKLN